MYPRALFLHACFTTRRDTQYTARTYVADRLKLQSMFWELSFLAAQVSLDPWRVTTIITDTAIEEYRDLLNDHTLEAMQFVLCPCRSGPLWGLLGGTFLAIRIVPVSVPIQGLQVISAMSIAQHRQVALYRDMWVRG